MSTLIIGPSMNWLEDTVINEIKNSIPELEVIRTVYKEFPDGESYVRLPIDKLSSKETIILQTLSPPQDRALIQLLQIIDAALNLGAEKIIVFSPYLAYTRQDKVFLKGEPISIRVVLNSIYAAGARFLFTIDIHNPFSLAIFPGKSENLLPLHLLVKPILQDQTSPESVLIIAPDKGALDRARKAAEYYNLEYEFLEKQRDRQTGEVVINDRGIDVKNKKVLIIDDIISTGGTISLASKILYDKGAKEVNVACSHALLIGDSYQKIKSSGVKNIYSLNTLPPKLGIQYIEAMKWSIEQVIMKI